MPLKFGPEITTEVTCARVRLEVADAKGRTAVGWGETPLSVQWVWPSALSYEARHETLKRFCLDLAAECYFISLNWMNPPVTAYMLEGGREHLHDYVALQYVSRYMIDATLAHEDVMPIQRTCAQRHRHPAGSGGRIGKFAGI